MKIKRVSDTLILINIPSKVGAFIWEYKGRRNITNKKKSPHWPYMGVGVYKVSAIDKKEKLILAVEKTFGAEDKPNINEVDILTEAQRLYNEKKFKEAKDIIQESGLKSFCTNCLPQTVVKSFLTIKGYHVFDSVST